MSRMPETARILPFPTNDARAVLPRTSENCLPPQLRDRVLAHVNALGGGEGQFPLPMPGVNVIRAKRHVPANPQIYKPSLCIVFEGLKQIEFGGQSLEYGVMECLIVNMEIPATGRIVGSSPDEPFLGMVIEFDADLLRSVLEQLPNPPAPRCHDGPSLFVTEIGDQLADCLVRLMRMAQTPEAVPILYPAVMRGNFAQTLRIEQLADIAGMSPSSFHQHFKALTLMTPVQFQKQLRLLEARRLMIAEAANVTDAAYQVGYESASQFSREYSRNFGIAPKRDVMMRRALLAEVGAG